MYKIVIFVMTCFHVYYCIICIILHCIILFMALAPLLYLSGFYLAPFLPTNSPLAASIRLCAPRWHVRENISLRFHTLFLQKTYFHSYYKIPLCIYTVFSSFINADRHVAWFSLLGVVNSVIIKMDGKVSL